MRGPLSCRQLARLESTALSSVLPLMFWIWLLRWPIAIGLRKQCCRNEDRGQPTSARACALPHLAGAAPPRSCSCLNVSELKLSRNFQRLCDRLSNSKIELNATTMAAGGFANFPRSVAAESFSHIFAQRGRDRDRDCNRRSFLLQRVEQCQLVPVEGVRQLRNLNEL